MLKPNFFWQIIALIFCETLGQDFFLFNVWQQIVVEHFSLQLICLQMGLPALKMTPLHLVLLARPASFICFPSFNVRTSRAPTVLFIFIFMNRFQINYIETDLFGFIAKIVCLL